MDCQDHYWDGNTSTDAVRLLRPLMDDLPDDVLAISISASGDILWTSTDPDLQQARCTYYPSVAEYQLPRPIPTLMRSELTVVDHLSGNVDKVCYKLP
jgi:hypothetical protein